MKNTLSELCSNNWHCREFLDISHICRKVRQSSLFSLQFQQAYNLNTRNFSENVKHKIVLFHLYFLLRGRVWRNFALKIRIIDLIFKFKGVNEFFEWMSKRVVPEPTFITLNQPVGGLTVAFVSCWTFIAIYELQKSEIPLSNHPQNITICDFKQFFFKYLSNLFCYVLLCFKWSSV